MVILVLIPEQWDTGQEYIHGCTCAAAAPQSRRHPREISQEMLEKQYDTVMNSASSLMMEPSLYGQRATQCSSLAMILVY